MFDTLKRISRWAVPGLVLATTVGCSGGPSGFILSKLPSGSISAIVPHVVNDLASLWITITNKSGYAVQNISGISWNTIQLDLKNSGLIGGTGTLSNTITPVSSQTTVTTAFQYLKPGSGYDLTVYLKQGNTPTSQVVGSADSGSFALNAGANSEAITVQEQSASIDFGAVSHNANVNGNVTGGADVILGDAVSIATGIPATTTSGIAQIQAFVGPGGAGPAAITAEATISNPITTQSSFGTFTWQTATAVALQSNGGWIYTNLNPSTIVGGATGSATPTTCGLYFKLWDSNGNLLGQTASMSVNVYQPASINVTLQ